MLDSPDALIVSLGSCREFRLELWMLWCWCGDGVLIGFFVGFEGEGCWVFELKQVLECPIQQDQDFGTTRNIRPGRAPSDDSPNMYWHVIEVHFERSRTLESKGEKGKTHYAHEPLCSRKNGKRNNALIPNWTEWCLLYGQFSCAPFPISKIDLLSLYIITHLPLFLLYRLLCFHLHTLITVASTTLLSFLLTLHYLLACFLIFLFLSHITICVLGLHTTHVHLNFSSCK